MSMQQSTIQLKIYNWKFKRKKWIDILEEIFSKVEEKKTIRWRLNEYYS